LREFEVAGPEQQINRPPFNARMSLQAGGEHHRRIAQRFLPIPAFEFCIWGCGGEAPAVHFIFKTMIKQLASVAFR
jgi:hypothetical protein